MKNQKIKDLSLKVSILLKEKGLTQTKLADRIGITQAALSKILSGKNSIKLTTVQNIAKALDVSAEYLINDKNNKNISDNARQKENDVNVNLIIKLVEKNSKLIDEQNKVIEEMKKSFEEKMKRYKAENVLMSKEIKILKKETDSLKKNFHG